MTKRAHNFIDLSGKKFNRLTAIEPIKTKNGIKWKCLCECGETAFIAPAKLKSGHTKSCGCYQSESARDRKMQHGFSRSKLSNVRNAMVQRCTNKNTDMFYRYGGRGIKVCESWANNPESFYKWAIENGYKEGLSIDRIDNDGDYNPSNCQWIPIEENIAKNAKLSEEDIAKICSMYIENDISCAKIASIFEVDNSRICQILKAQNIKVSRRNQHGEWK